MAAGTTRRTAPIDAGGAAAVAIVKKTESDPDRDQAHKHTVIYLN
jgi:hypothetical protein